MKDQAERENEFAGEKAKRKVVDEEKVKREQRLEQYNRSAKFVKKMQAKIKDLSRTTISERRNKTKIEKLKFKISSEQISDVFQSAEYYYTKATKIDEKLQKLAGNQDLTEMKLESTKAVKEAETVMKKARTTRAKLTPENHAKILSEMKALKTDAMMAMKACTHSSKQIDQIIQNTEVTGETKKCRKKMQEDVWKLDMEYVKKQRILRERNRSKLNEDDEDELTTLKAQTCRRTIEKMPLNENLWEAKTQKLHERLQGKKPKRGQFDDGEEFDLRQD